MDGIPIIAYIFKAHCSTGAFKDHSPSRFSILSESSRDQLVLATVSHDRTFKLWSISDLSCLYESAQVRISLPLHFSSAKANETKPKRGFGRVFNSRLGCFVILHNKSTAHMQPLLGMNENSFNV
jgi:hypothetical protein